SSVCCVTDGTLRIAPFSAEYQDTLKACPDQSERAWGPMFRVEMMQIVGMVRITDAFLSRLVWQIENRSNAIADLLKVAVVARSCPVVLHVLAPRRARVEQLPLVRFVRIDPDDGRPLMPRFVKRIFGAAALRFSITIPHHDEQIRLIHDHASCDAIRGR